MLDDGIEGTVLVVRRTAEFDAGGAFGYDLLFERLHQPRLANAGLATEQDDLPFAAFRLCPPLAQQANFQISADQRRQSCIDRDLKTALRCTLPQDSVHGNSVRHEICLRLPFPIDCTMMKKKQSRVGTVREKAVGEAPTPVVQGFKYVRLVNRLLERLHGAATERDRAGNRQLFYDHYATLVLLYFFTPTVTSLRGLQQLTTLAYIQRRWGVPRTALGSLSEAARVFEAALLQDVISELALRAWTRAPHGNPALLKGDLAVLRDLVAIDGSLLPALPRMVWAVWQDEQHRAAKLHLAFAALRQVPVGVTVTAGNGSERAQTRQLVQPGGFYVFDRGYVDYGLFVEVHALSCSFCGCVPG